MKTCTVFILALFSLSVTYAIPMSVSKDNSSCVLPYSTLKVVVDSSQHEVSNLTVEDDGSFIVPSHLSNSILKVELISEKAWCDAHCINEPSTSN